MEHHLRMLCLLKNKSICLIILFLSLSYEGLAQKHDYIWVNGYDAVWGGEFGNFLLDFHQSPVKVDSIEFQYAELSDQVTSYCDDQGIFRMVSNGCRLYDHGGNIIANSDTLVPGKLGEYVCTKVGSFPLAFGSIFLPLEAKKVFLYHQGARDDNLFTITRWPAYKTIVDISEDIPIVDSIHVKIESFHAEAPAVCQHGNGQDWWIITPERNTNNYHVYCTAPNGGVTIKTQEIGSDYPYNECPGAGIQSFAPDGTTFVRYNNSCGLSFFSFDRCTGTLSYERLINLPEVFSPGAATVFSPNSRFCYFNSSRVIMQVDMEEAILHADTVAIVDTFPAPFGAGFFLMQLAPDGRVYICTTSSTKAWHVIEYPDKKGPACWVRPNALEFPYWSYHAMPNIPNYRLGAWAGSPCDTLGLSATDIPLTPTLAHRVYPNPVSNAFMLELDEGLQHSQPWTLIIMDATGREVTRRVIPPYAYLHLVETDTWPSGLYPYILQDETGRVLATGKLVKEP